MNLYNYVGGDPVNSTDPTGLCIISNWEDVWIPKFDDGSEGSPVVDDSGVSFEGCSPFDPFGPPTLTDFSRFGSFADGQSHVVPCSIAEDAIRDEDGNLRLAVSILVPLSQLGSVDAILDGTSHPVEYGIFAGFRANGDVVFSNHFTSGDRRTIDGGLIRRQRYAFERRTGITASILIHTHPNNPPPTTVSDPGINLAKSTAAAVIAIGKDSPTACTKG